MSQMMNQGGMMGGGAGRSGGGPMRGPGGNSAGRDNSAPYSRRSHDRSDRGFGGVNSYGGGGMRRF